MRHRARAGRAGGNLTLDRTALAYMRVIVWGLFRDRLWPRRTFGELDREPYDAWLKRHGASDAVIDSPLAQAPLRLLYQYPGGDAAAHPRGDMAPGADPLTAQWARAHVQPSDRYVQAPAGSAEARLEAGASGFAGLVLAGDWIHTGLNVVCVEATVMSGRLAANAVTGRPPGEGLVGYFPKV